MHGPDSSHNGRLPNATGGIARLACARALAAGITLEPLLKKCGVTPQEIEDRSIRLKVQKQIQLLALIAAALSDEFLGFHLSLDFDFREIGLLHYTMASSATLADALHRAARYSQIANEGVVIRYNEAEDVEIVLDYVGVARHSDRHQIEFLAVTIMRACRELTDRQVIPHRVCFLHHRSEDCSEVASFFGSEVAYGADQDMIVLPRSVLDLPVVSADPYLNDILVKYCEEALAQRNSAAGPLRSAVENAIAPLLPHGTARLPDIARKLGMSERTLARRLATEGLSFNLILDQLRADLARRHIGDHALSISQIAWLLGYQEVSAFTHAFKRWTGVTPRAMRSAASVEAA